MNRIDSLNAARDLADDLDIDDEQFIDEVLVDDEMFAAWAYIYEQASIYVDEVDRTLAVDDMKRAARRAKESARYVAVCRAEDLLGERLDDGPEGRAFRGP